MARPQKDGVKVNYYMDRAISEQLEKYCEETGQTKTLAMERMLKKELEAYFQQPEGKRVPIQ